MRMMARVCVIANQRKLAKRSNVVEKKNEKCDPHLRVVAKEADGVVYSLQFRRRLHTQHQQNKIKTTKSNTAFTTNNNYKK